MKKVIWVLSVICIVGTFMLFSEETKAESFSIRSINNISMTNGENQKIKIYSEDIQYLANEIEKLKNEIH